MEKAQIINGKLLAEQILSQIKSHIDEQNTKRAPGLATVLVGEDKASKLYVTNKRKAAARVGITSFHHELSKSTSERELLDLIGQLNSNEGIDAILVQLPLPPRLKEKVIIDAIDPNKDADGIHPLNLGLLLRGDPKVLPCTPQGIIHLIRSVGYPLVGKRAVVLGRSNIVGKPMAHLLLQENATVTVCHSHTKDLADITKQADVLIAAMGKPNFINRSHIKPGAFIVDVGINRDDSNKLCGDVNLEDVSHVASYITPVPGGVGPLTIAMLLNNTLANFLRNEQ